MASQMRVSVNHCRNVYSRFTAFIHFIYIKMYLIFIYLSMSFQKIYHFIRYIFYVDCTGKTNDMFYWFYERKLPLGDIFNTTKFLSFIFSKRLKIYWVVSSFLFAIVPVILLFLIVCLKLEWACMFTKYVM